MDNAPISKLTFPEARELAHATAIFQDLAFVVQVTSKLTSLLRNGDPDQITTRSLFTVALIAYVRCFSSGKRAVLNPDIFKSLPGEPLACHQQYKDTRDKHIAHSVNPFEETLVGAVLSPQEGAAREVVGVACLTASLSAFDADGVEQLGRLASFAQGHVATVCRELQDRVLELAKEMDLDELYATQGLRITPKGGPVVAATPRKE